MSQMSFGDAEYAGKRKRTRRELFLAEMERETAFGTLTHALLASWLREPLGPPPEPDWSGRFNCRAWI